MKRMSKLFHYFYPPVPVSDLSTSESSKASPEVIVGGALGGALALVLVVLVVIVMVITITMKRKKSAVYQLQLETLRFAFPHFSNVHVHHCACI